MSAMAAREVRRARHRSPSIDSARIMRRAGAREAALAGLDGLAQPHAALDRRLRARAGVERAGGATDRPSPPLWELGHLGWFQERWIARNVLQRQRGARVIRRRAPALHLSDADRCFDPAEVSHAVTLARRPARAAGGAAIPRRHARNHAPAARGHAEDDDDALYFYRLRALPRRPARRAVRADEPDAGLPNPACSPRRRRNARDALLFPPRAGRWAASRAASYSTTKWVHEVELPGSRSMRSRSAGSSSRSSSKTAATTRSSSGTRRAWEWLQREGAALRRATSTSCVTACWAALRQPMRVLMA